MSIYTGIGSRSTPSEVLKQMTSLARQLAIKGWILRSGGASGADSAFENGCDQGYGEKEIYLPWRGFMGSTSRLCYIPPEAFQMASQYVSGFQYRTQGVKKLHARNVQQVLGRGLERLTDIVVCWTPRADHVGGTGTALAIAETMGVPIFNLASSGVTPLLEAYFGVKL